MDEQQFNTGLSETVVGEIRDFSKDILEPHIFLRSGVQEADLSDMNDFEKVVYSLIKLKGLEVINLMRRGRRIDVRSKILILVLSSRRRKILAVIARRVEILKIDLAVLSSLLINSIRRRQLVDRDIVVDIGFRQDFKIVTYVQDKSTNQLCEKCLDRRNCLVRSLDFCPFNRT